MKYKNCTVPPPTKEGKEAFRKQFMDMATKDLLPYQKKFLETFPSSERMLIRGRQAGKY